MRITYSPTADIGLNKILVYGIENWGEEQAYTFFISLFDEVKLLKTYPEIGQTYHPKNKALGLNNLRKFLFKGYQIFYQINPDEIYIYAIVAKGADVGEVLG